MTNAVIVDYVRTPFARAFSPDVAAGKKGAYADILPEDMMVQLIDTLVSRTGLNPADVETLLTGCAFPEATQGLNVARNVILHPESKLPQSVGAVTLNRFCGSSMHVIQDAAAHIAAGAGEVFICTGVESMSQVPMSGWNPMLNPKIYDGDVRAYMNMGRTAENLARKYEIERALQEEFAMRSHQKASLAQQAGKFDQELVPLKDAPEVTADNAVRPETTLEKLAGLKPAFETAGTVTAGTSSPITDGASAVLVTSEEYAKKHNLPILARVKSFAGSGCAPEIMGIGPVESSRKALQRAGLEIKDIDIFELNEAFAAQALAVIKDLGIEQEKVNLDGGAIALGHPLGASGARITGKAASLLQRENKRYALATMCIGGGQGVAMVLENPKFG
jgi:acetyl-CoA acyltransferase